MTATPSQDRLEGAAEHYREHAAVVDGAVADVVDVLAAVCGDESRAMLRTEDELNIFNLHQLRSLAAAALVKLARRARDDARAQKR